MEVTDKAESLLRRTLALLDPFSALNKEIAQYFKERKENPSYSERKAAIFARSKNG